MLLPSEIPSTGGLSLLQPPWMQLAVQLVLPLPDSQRHASRLTAPPLAASAFQLQHWPPWSAKPLQPAPQWKPDPWPAARPNMLIPPASLQQQPDSTLLTSEIP